MKCRRCGSKSTTSLSYPYAVMNAGSFNVNVRKRRRRCQNPECRQTFITCEMMASDARKLALFGEKMAEAGMTMRSPLMTLLQENRGRKPMSKAAESIKELRQSSLYSHPGPQGFVVDIDGEKLPGGRDPEDFLHQIGIKEENVSGRDVAVVYPENGGLLVALAKMGANTMIAVEPGYLFEEALRVVVKVMPRSTSSTVLLSKRFPKSGKTKVDVVFWPSGVNVEGEHTIHETMVLVLNMLKEGGSLYLECKEGYQKVSIKEARDRWEPDRQEIVLSLSRLSGVVNVVRVCDGGLEGYGVYRLDKAAPVVVIESEIPAKVAEEPKEPQVVVGTPVDPEPVESISLESDVPGEVKSSRRGRRKKVSKS